MTTARDIAWALMASFLIAGAIFATPWWLAAIFGGFLGGR